MGNDFEFRIGMTTQQVISSISRTNATDKTKQMIINFCNNDQDKKISDEVELTMLNSWASGSEKIKMPAEPKDKPLSVETYKYRTLKTYKAGNADKISFARFTNGTNVFTSFPATQSKYDTQNQLIDTDGDGYADRRETTYDDYTGYGDNTIIRYYDNNLDGSYDKKNETIYKHDKKDTRLYNETNLDTGETKNFRIWYNNKQQEWTSHPKTDLEKLDDWY